MITIDHVTKSFPGVTALDDVAFSIQSGSVHGLVGENGAGKSTLIKILSGIYQPEKGSVVIDGQPTAIASVHDAQSKGIATIFQELTIVPDPRPALPSKSNRAGEQDPYRWVRAPQRLVRLTGSHY